MNVIFHGIDEQDWASQIIQNGSHVGVKVRSDIFRQKGLTVFRAKNQVDVEACEGLRHDSNLGRPFRAYDLDPCTWGVAPGYLGPPRWGC